MKKLTRADELKGMNTKDLKAMLAKTPGGSDATIIKKIIGNRELEEIVGEEIPVKVVEPTTARVKADAAKKAKAEKAAKAKADKEAKAKAKADKDTKAKADKDTKAKAKADKKAESKAKAEERKLMSLEELKKSSDYVRAKEDIGKLITFIPGANGREDESITGIITGLSLNRRLGRIYYSVQEDGSNKRVCCSLDNEITSMKTPKGPSKAEIAAKAKADKAAKAKADKAAKTKADKAAKSKK